MTSMRWKTKERIHILLFYYFWLFNTYCIGISEGNENLNRQNTLQFIQGQLIRKGANALRNKGELFNKGSQQLFGFADRINPRQVKSPKRPPADGNAVVIFDENSELLTPDESNLRNPINPVSTVSPLSPLMQSNPINLVNPVNPSLTMMDPQTFAQLQDLMRQRHKLQLIQQQIDILRQNQIGAPPQFLRQQQQQQQTFVPHRSGTCDERLSQLIGDIFIGNEIIPQILDSPPDHPLELTYRTQRTFPGMKLTADATRFKPIMNWPTENGALYTVILSNLDINNRANRSLSEFWHWLVGNIPGTNIDDGEEIFQILPPLVLPHGEGDHRFGYFVLKQPGRVDYSDEGGPTVNCGPTMANGRGPKRSTRDFIRKYNLHLTAATFLIIDHNEASNQLACQWQTCMGGEVFLDDLDCSVEE